MLTRSFSRPSLAFALAICAFAAQAQPTRVDGSASVYAREPLTAGRAQYARAVLATYGPSVAFYDRLGAQPERRLSGADLSELFASVAFSTLGCEPGDASCEAKARRAGVKSASKVSKAPSVGEAITAELAESYPQAR